MNLSGRVSRVEPSATMAVSNLAREVRAEGHDVVDLSVGEPDFDTPENVRRAGKDAIDAGHTTYTSSAGIPDLREAIADKLREDGVDADADRVVVTPGAKQALYEAVQTLVESGDEVVLLDPAWVSYEPMVKLAGGETVHVDLASHDFRLEPALDGLDDAITEDTALVLVNSPNNPTGAVYSDAALEGVRDLAVDHDVPVLSDEIYERISYGRDPTSLASLDGMADRTVTVNGFSKAYSMTGWRLGYLAGPAEFVDAAGRVQSHSVSCAANFVQRAGVEALRNTERAVRQMVRAFEERRDLVLDLCDEHGLDVPTPDGAFYAMLPVDDDDQSWCTDALRESHVAAVPGSAFGAPGYARISYAASESRIEEGFRRLAEGGFV